jgi:hypothetical protein
MKNSRAAGPLGGRVRSMLVGAALMLPACFHPMVSEVGDVSRGGPEPGAQLVVGGTEYRLSRCFSGDREYFLGVDLTDGAQETVLRVVIDSVEGARLRLTRSKGGVANVVILGAEDCRELQATVEPTGWVINRVRDVKGEVRAECTARDGTELRAQMAFTHCH